MPRFMITAAAAIALAAAAGAAHAGVSYAAFLFDAQDASGTPIADGTFVMVADLDNDGWNGVAYTAQSPGPGNSDLWLWDADDLLMDRGRVGDGGVPGEAYPAWSWTAALPAGYTAGVDHYYMLWFDVPYNASAAGPGEGVRYGAEDLGTLGDDPGDYSAFPVGGSGTLTTLAGAGASWHNGALAADVDGDGIVTEDDALIVLAKLNAEGPHALSLAGDPLFGDGGFWWDVTGDATPYLSPLDALRVINAWHLAPPSGGPPTPTPVPEPASVLLLLAGGGLLARRLPRRPTA